MQQVGPYLAGALAHDGAVGQRLRRGDGLPSCSRELGVWQIPERAPRRAAGCRHTSGTAGRSPRQLAVTLREQRLQALTAEGGRASERMFLLIVVFILIPLMGSSLR